MQSILEHIRAEIAATEDHLRKLKMAEAMLKADVPIQPSPEMLGNSSLIDPNVHEAKPTSGSLTAALQAHLTEFGPMTKGNLEKALSANRTLGRQTVSAALQAMKRRGIAKLLKSGKWKLS